jgi:hypothetical protein
LRQNGAHEFQTTHWGPDRGIPLAGSRPADYKFGVKFTSIRGVACWIIAVLLAQGCAATRPSSAPRSAESGAIVWKLDNLKSIDGLTPEVVGAPEVISTASGRAMHFNGASDGIFLPANPIKGAERFTIELLFRPDTTGPREQRFLHVQDDTNARGLMELRLFDNGWALDAFLLSGASQKALFDATKLHPAGEWTWVAMEYADGKISSYVNGMKELEGDVTFPPMSAGTISLGVRQNRVSWFKGDIGEVRFHPKALPAENLQRVR